MVGEQLVAYGWDIWTGEHLLMMRFFHTQLKPENVFQLTDMYKSSVTCLLGIIYYGWPSAVLRSCWQVWIDVLTARFRRAWCQWSTVPASPMLQSKVVRPSSCPGLLKPCEHGCVAREAWASSPGWFSPSARGWIGQWSCFGDLWTLLSQSG